MTKQYRYPTKDELGCTYAFEAWQTDVDEIEFTIRTSEGEFTFVVTERRAHGVVKEIFTAVPSLRDGGPSVSRSMAE